MFTCRESGYQEMSEYQELYTRNGQMKNVFGTFTTTKMTKRDESVYYEQKRINHSHSTK